MHVHTRRRPGSGLLQPLYHKHACVFLNATMHRYPLMARRLCCAVPELRSAFVPATVTSTRSGQAIPQTPRCQATAQPSVGHELRLCTRRGAVVCDAPCRAPSPAACCARPGRAIRRSLCTGRRCKYRAWWATRDWKRRRVRSTALSIASTALTSKRKNRSQPNVNEYSERSQYTSTDVKD